MKAKVEKKAKKLMKKRIKEESKKTFFFRLHQVTHNYASSQYPFHNFSRSTWENLPSSIGRIIPSSHMI
jgi:hypothetical protein